MRTPFHLVTSTHRSSVLSPPSSLPSSSFLPELLATVHGSFRDEVDLRVVTLDLKSSLEFVPSSSEGWRAGGRRRRRTGRGREGSSGRRVRRVRRSVERRGRREVGRGREGGRRRRGRTSASRSSRTPTSGREAIDAVLDSQLDEARDIFGEGFEFGGMESGGEEVASRPSSRGSSGRTSTV